MERKVLDHERDGRWYGVLAYIVGKSLVEIPLGVIPVSLSFSLISSFSLHALGSCLRRYCLLDGWSQSVV